MKVRRLVIALAASSVLALGGTAALAESGGSGTQSGANHASRCDRAESLLEKLQGQASKLSDRVTKLQAKIDGGTLSDKQLAKAQQRLAKLEDRLAKLQSRIDKLSGRIADKCSDSSGSGDGSGDGTTASPE